MSERQDPDVPPLRPGLATALSLVLFLVATAAAIADGVTGLDEPLFYVLLGLALAGSLFAARYEGAVLVSADIGCSLLAAAFLGPFAVLAINVVLELVTWIARRYEFRKVAWNLGAITAPMVFAALLFEALTMHTREGSLAFLAILAGVSVLAITVNYFIVRVQSTLAYGSTSTFKVPFSALPAEFWTVGFVVAAAAVYAKYGFGASAIVVLFVGAFAYMSHLVVRARERTKEYANLSWGILSSLVATLDARDSRAARHCAAVAMFSRDIARHVGMSKKDQELAHTAGLLHDIGKFALSDRVMDGEGVLTEEDWRGIRNHPELGAMLLKDVGVYGPVDEIVRAHHERIDGRGYPGKLRGDDIPPIARIVAVAEVYDTLTAPDTYRSPMSSFEALTELRRVTGTQLDGRYVEALAELLAGEGIDYRHADAADFDRELDIQRRMNEAAAR